ncbi:MAG: archaetidylserine decarboxylase, partial [Sandaracinaceae bacterium]|nr:archaetidylserine decarboxylase [Sandaracinaceae bacterium]
AFHVKGQRYSVGDLLGDPSAAGRFVGGAFCIVYLSPRDYHRVHAPVTGPVHTVRHVGGTLLPVNAFGARNYPGLLARNERVVVVQSKNGADVASILVGAVGVGRISLAFDSSVMTNVGRGPTTLRYPPSRAPTLARGEELGIFHLGSTVVVFVAPELGPRLSAVSGQDVRMGRGLGILEAG